MDWIANYQLFLFDFDGLLVDTENLHYQSYIEMCRRRGAHLSWDFSKYSSLAHHSSESLKAQILKEFPNLVTHPNDWSQLYQEKSDIFFESISKENVSLLPGVETLLKKLQHEHIKHCVVTHSSSKLIEKIRSHYPLLSAIPHWITRENYSKPKPSSECYLQAIEKFSLPGDKIIGFEDSPRGLKALLGSTAKPVLICPPHSIYLRETLEKWPIVRYFPSFEAIENL